MVAESRVAQWLGVSDADSAARQEQLIAQYGLPTSAEGLDDARAVAALHRDKKIVAGRLRLPLVPEIGRFEIVEDVPLELVERGLRSLCA
jgi:3-dehydroquinate synthase